VTSVFISFRNGDEPFAAALIWRALAHRFGPTNVFRSSDSIAPGTAFAEAIWDNHDESEVVVVVIGPRWLTIEDNGGRRRLFQEDDWVYLEIARAFEAGKYVIPVLLRGVERFAGKDLPPRITSLAGLQAITIDHRTTEVAIAQLVAEITRRVPALLDQDATRPADRPPAAHPSTDPPSDPPSAWLEIWNVPARLPSYVDREEQLRAVRELMLSSRQRHAVVLSGGVGVGKTTLAQEYAHRYAGDYELVWWLSGQAPRSLPAQMAALACAAGLDPGPDVESALPDLFARLGARVGPRGRWLLVVDGAGEPAEAARYIASPGLTADVLVTSRDPDWGQIAAAYDLGPLTREQSLRLLRPAVDAGGSVDAAREAELDALAAALDDVALAVAQAAVYLRRSALTAGRYRELLATRAPELLRRGSAQGYSTSLAAVWSVAMEALAAASAPARDLVRVLSCCAAAPLPLSVLTSGAAGLPAGLAEVVADPILFDDVLRAIDRSGLVAVDKEAIRPYWLFQRFVAESVPGDERAGLREAARRMLGLADRPDPREPDAPAVYDPMLAHVFALDLAAGDDAGSHRLLLDVAHYLVVRADAGTARDLTADALGRWRYAYGPDTDESLAAASQLARAYYRLGNYRRALEFDEAVLRRRHRRGDDGIPLATAAHNVAIDRWAAAEARRDRDDMTVAGALLDEVVVRRTRLLGADHPDTLRSLHCLALARRGAGDVAGARELDERVHRRLVAALGPDHPDTLLSAHALVVDLHALGRFAEADPLARETYETRARVLGPDHPQTLQSGYLHAVNLRGCGEAGPALTVASETYRRRDRVLGADHVDTLRSRYQMGLALIETGDSERGERIRREAGQRLVRRFRPDLISQPGTPQSGATEP
jgi:hypothetical protein